MKEMLTVNEVADMLGVAKSTVYQLIFYGRIPYYKMSKKCVRFKKSEIEKWLQARHKEECPRPKLSNSKQKTKAAVPATIIDRIVEQVKEQVNREVR